MGAGEDNPSFLWVRNGWPGRQAIQRRVSALSPVFPCPPNTKKDEKDAENEMSELTTETRNTTQTHYEGNFGVFDLSKATFGEGARIIHRKASTALEGVDGERRRDAST